ncbi:MAG: hypothetical protein H7833_12500 [Magnetococcus sp. DMHC-1]
MIKSNFQVLYNLCEMLFVLPLYRLFKFGGQPFGLHSRIVVYLLVAISFSRLCFEYGVRWSGDSARFSEWADVLIHNDLNPFIYLQYSGRIFYSVWIFLVSLMKIIFADNWMIAIVTINFLCAFLTSIITIEAIAKFSKNRVVPIFSAILFSVSTEYFQWIPWVLSDITFSLLLSVVFVFLLSSIDKRKIGVSAKKIGASLAVVAFFFRPGGQIVAFFCVSFFVLAPYIVDKGEYNRKIVINILLTIILFAIIAVFGWAALMKNPHLLPLNIAHETFSQLSDEYKMGVVVYLKKETYRNAPQNIYDFAVIIFLKMGYYLQFLSNNNGIFHNIINSVIFIFAGYSGLCAVLPISNMSVDNLNRAWWGLFIVICFTIFYATQYIDYDARYRMPLIPILIQMAALGFNQIWNYMSSSNFFILSHK